MSWALLDDNFPHHPKTQKAGDLAAYLYVCGLCYCRKYHTGGFIPVETVKKLGLSASERPLVDKLLRENLWERVEGGFQVHDYDVLYPNDAEERAEKSDRSRQRSESGRLGGLAKAAARAKQPPSTSPSKQPSKDVANAYPIGSGNGSGSEAFSGKELSPEQIGDEFQRFQAAFHPAGRRGGPLPFGYFERARVGGVGFQTMLDALENHKQSAQWQAGKVPSLVTWLQDQWWLTRLDPPKAPEGSTDGLAGLRAQLAKAGKL
jgi:hypothetical protein